jgi:hypothetical protein
MSNPQNRGQACDFAILTGADANPTEVRRQPLFTGKLRINISAQCAEFADGCDVSGKSQAGDSPSRKNRKIASLTPVLVIYKSFRGLFICSFNRRSCSLGSQ